MTDVDWPHRAEQAEVEVNSLWRGGPRLILEQWFVEQADQTAPTQILGCRRRRARPPTVIRDDNDAGIYIYWDWNGSEHSDQVALTEAGEGEWSSSRDGLSVE